MAGGFPLRVKLAANGIWVLRQGQVRYELIIDPSVERQALSKGLAAAIKSDKIEGMSKKASIEVELDMRFTSRKMLWGGEQGMSYIPMGSAAQLLPPDRPGPGITMTPFDLVGMMGPDERLHPGRLIEESKTRTGVACKFDGMERVRGRNLLVVAYDDASGTDKLHSKYWFDPERGYLPVQMTGQSDNPAHVRTKVVVTDVRECSGGRWFPMRSVKILSSGPSESGSELDVFDLTVTDLDVDARPSDEMLAIDIPKGVRMHNGVDPQSQMALKEGQRISVADLGGVKEDLSRRAKEARILSEQGASPFEPAGPSRIRFLIVVSTSLLIFVLVALWLRRRRRSKGGE